MIHGGKTALAIREALPEDVPALVELERLSPEEGQVALRIEIRADNLDLFARYPGAKGYLALDGGNSEIVGTVFASSAPTQLNGRLVPATYLFGLRVHPAHRRRGVASALIAHACERAWMETGVRAVWAAVVDGNTASLRTFDRAGFHRLRDMRVKILPPLLPQLRIPSRAATRPASRADLPALAEALNRLHAGHNFWRPKSADGLWAEFDLLRHSPHDFEIAMGEDGTVLAAAGGLDLARVARLRLLDFRLLPGRVNRLLAPLFGLIPLNLLLIRYFVSSPDRAHAGSAVLRQLARRSSPSPWVAVVADPLDPIWGGVGVWGITGRVHLVVRSEEPIDQSRPSYIP